MGLEGPHGPKGEKGDGGDRGGFGDKGERGDVGCVNKFVLGSPKNDVTDTEIRNKPYYLRKHNNLDRGLKLSKICDVISDGP